jgi:hypothetical protein
MPKYLVTLFHPEDYDSAAEDAAMGRDIDRLNEEMVAAGVRVFVGGLHPPATACSFRLQPGRKVVDARGPYLKTPEHIAGLWVLEAADLEKASEWGRKAAVACRAPVEVRAFH